MKEFGSDFSSVDNLSSEKLGMVSFNPRVIYLAYGRQCLASLITHFGWKRIWIPEFYSKSAIDYVANTGVEILYYIDYPSNYEIPTIASLPYQKGDVLLRVNYYGLRGYRSEADIPVPVIEDHTHDLFGQWASNSNADWCIGSLRKTYPIAQGAALWSPKGYEWNTTIVRDDANEAYSAEIWQAMDMKRDYLEGKVVDKSVFQKIFDETNDIMNQIPVCHIDKRSEDFIRNFDFYNWNIRKQQNWAQLRRKLSSHFEILEPEKIYCLPFSFLFLAPDKKERDFMESALKRMSIIPDTHWPLYEEAHNRVVDISERLIAIHCDGRYTADEMVELAELLCIYL